jgi:hypothetical protein
VRILIAGGALIVAAAGVFLAWRQLRVSFRIEGLRDGVALNRAEIEAGTVRVTVSDGASPRLTLNGVSLGEPVADGGASVWRLPNVVDGSYTLELSARRPLFGTAHRTLHFRVDSKAPVIGVPSTAAAVGFDDPVTVGGTLDEPATVTADGAAVNDAGSSFSLRFARAPTGPVTVTATDAAGNTSSVAVIVPVTRPVTHAVHVTALAWADPTLNGEIEGLIDAHLINAVELDLKDESGIVGYDSKVPLANEIGAVQTSYTLGSTVAELHAKGIRVIGRIVAFRDPVLAKYEWKAGNHDWVVQNDAGQPLNAYGGFANFASADVQAYNLAIADEAARSGVDEILWDYVRRPEGPLDSMVFPGLSGGVDEAIAAFLAKGQALLRPLKTLQGASVFGIAATRPDEVGQNVPAIAAHTDYVAPMLYPSHWNKGEYGVADPNRQPYDIVKASLSDFVTEVAPTGRAVAPWLQDFDDGVRYGAPEVQAQIEAAKELGVESWLLWNPDTVYTEAALTPIQG